MVFATALLLFRNKTSGAVKEGRRWYFGNTANGLENSEGNDKTTITTAVTVFRKAAKSNSVLTISKTVIYGALFC